MSDHYAEFISVRRHILQCEADGEDDLFAKMAEHAKGEWVDGLQISDDSEPLLIHEDYGSLEVGEADDGPAWFQGNVFGTNKTWMRELGEKLIALSEED